MLMVAGCSKEHTPDNERGYDLRILTFEDADAKFSPFILDYAEHTVSTWSDLVDDAQYDGKLLYGDYTEHTYRWYDLRPSYKRENTDGSRGIRRGAQNTLQASLRRGLQCRTQEKSLRTKT